MMTRKPPAASAAIRDLEPYTSARMLNALDTDGLYLDANEAPLALDSTSVDLSNIRHYADDKAALECAYSTFLQVPEQQILAMRGVDEAIDLVIRAFCEPHKDSILTFIPTYGGYAAAAAAHRVQLLQEPFAADGSIDVAKALSLRPRVIFLCRPNNPTGSVVPLSHVVALAEAVSDETLIAVDEAYAEFMDAPSALGLLSDYANIVVMRTMSKAFALAGAHVGFAVGHVEVVDAMRKIINPYPVPDPCLQLAMQSLSPSGLAFLSERTADNRVVRDWFTEELEKRRGCLKVLPSETSFVAARFYDAASVYETLRAQKIFIRPLPPMLGEDNWLRFTIGTRGDMERVVNGMPD